MVIEDISLVLTRMIHNPADPSGQLGKFPLLQCLRHGPPGQILPGSETGLARYDFFIYISQLDYARLIAEANDEHPWP